MLFNTKLSNLVLKTHLSFESFMMINYVKKNKRKNSIFFLHDGLFFYAVFNLEHKPIMEYTAVSREVVRQKAKKCTQP